MRRYLLFAVCFLGLGCSSVRPLAQHGVDLLENTERSYAVRSVAAGGSFLGVIVALPVTILLLHTYAFEGAYGWGVREPTETEGTRAPGDYTIPMALVPIEYGIGMGSGILASPFAWMGEAFGGSPPGLAEGWVDEVREDPPGGDEWLVRDIEPIPREPVPEEFLRSEPVPEGAAPTELPTEPVPEGPIPEGPIPEGVVPESDEP